MAHRARRFERSLPAGWREEPADHGSIDGAPRYFNENNEEMVWMHTDRIHTRLRLDGVYVTDSIHTEEWTDRRQFVSLPFCASLGFNALTQERIRNIDIQCHQEQEECMRKCSECTCAVRQLMWVVVGLGLAACAFIIGSLLVVPPSNTTALAVGIVFIVAGSSCVFCSCWYAGTVLTNCFQSICPRAARPDAKPAAKATKPKKYKHGDIIIAAATHNVHALSSCIELGASVDETDEHGYTPLMWAANNGHSGTAYLLIAHGANVRYTSNDGRFALRGAACSGSKDICEMLLKAGVDKNQTHEGLTSAQWASAKGHHDVAAFIESWGKEAAPAPAFVSPAVSPQQFALAPFPHVHIAPPSAEPLQDWKAVSLPAPQQYAYEDAPSAAYHDQLQLAAQPHYHFRQFQFDPSQAQVHDYRMPRPPDPFHDVVPPA